MAMAVQRQHNRLADGLITDLAGLWGVSLAYKDATGRVRESPREAVMEVLGCLAAATSAGPWPGAGSGGGLGAKDHEWLRAAADTRRAEVRDRLVAPVLVAWDGRVLFEVPRGAKVSLMPDTACEEGPEPRSRPTRGGADSSLAKWTVDLPFGYHRLRVESGGRAEEIRVISAPRRCWQQEPGVREWGVFAPTYALRGARDWGAGDLGELSKLLQVVSDAGGSAVATLPLLASYLDRPFEPSPYRPVSRLFWNEFYLEVERVPEWSGCGSARSVWESKAVQERITAWRSEDSVDYAGVMALKRRALEELCRCFFGAAGGKRRSALEGFVRERPEVLKYAEYRAEVERRGRDWRGWSGSTVTTTAVATSSPERLGELAEAARYHVYCQWQMEEQLRGLSGRDRQKGERASSHNAADLFLDVPVGVHPGGFDVWDRQDLFVRGMSIGSPPDAFFSHGQSWDSPPVHPEIARADGHSYWAEVLSHHMRFASRLRVDHIMSLHRLFWIPEGREPAEGVYVTYPADELYAVLCLESHRNRTIVAGEDLGTVPAGVRPSMRRHGVSGTWVLQSALRPRAERTVAPIPRYAVASLDTHDMFPLAGFVTGEDIRMRLRTGQMEDDAARRAFAARRRMVAALSSYLVGTPGSSGPAALLAAAVSYLARSPAEFVLIGIEDLLLQREAHNVPGSGAEAPNWRRRLAGEESQVERAVHEAAEWIDQQRPPRTRGRGGQGG